jgi:hypothetical protein
MTTLHCTRPCGRIEFAIRFAAGSSSARDTILPKRYHQCSNTCLFYRLTLMRVFQQYLLQNEVISPPVEKLEPDVKTTCDPPRPQRNISLDEDDDALLLFQRTLSKFFSTFFFPNPCGAISVVLFFEVLRLRCVYGPDRSPMAPCPASPIARFPAPAALLLQPPPRSSLPKSRRPRHLSPSRPVIADPIAVGRRPQPRVIHSSLPPLALPLARFQ